MRNLNKPPRYNVASIQAQQTLGGDVMQSHEQGDYVEFRDYQWLLTEKQRLDAENARLKSEVERLTKAGDAVIHEWSSGDEKDAKNFLKALAIWHAAKEGKQS